MNCSLIMEMVITDADWCSLRLPTLLLIHSVGSDLLPVIHLRWFLLLPDTYAITIACCTLIFGWYLLWLITGVVLFPMPSVFCSVFHSLSVTFVICGDLLLGDRWEITITVIVVLFVLDVDFSSLPSAFYCAYLRHLPLLPHLYHGTIYYGSDTLLPLCYYFGIFFDHVVTLEAGSVTGALRFVDCDIAVIYYLVLFITVSILPVDGRWWPLITILRFIVYVEFRDCYWYCGISDYSAVILNDCWIHSVRVFWWLSRYGIDIPFILRWLVFVLLEFLFIVVWCLLHYRLLLIVTICTGIVFIVFYCDYDGGMEDTFWSHCCVVVWSGVRPTLLRLPYCLVVDYLSPLVICGPIGDCSDCHSLPAIRLHTDIIAILVLWISLIVCRWMIIVPDRFRCSPVWNGASYITLFCWFCSIPCSAAFRYYCHLPALLPE